MYIKAPEQSMQCYFKLECKMSGIMTVAPISSNKFKVWVLGATAGSKRRYHSPQQSA
jgi:hypothetical protein